MIGRLLLLLLAVAIASCARNHGIRPDTASATPIPAQPATLPVSESTAEAEEGPEELLVVATQDRTIWEPLRHGFRLPDYQHARIDHEVQRLTRSKVALRALLTRAKPYLHHIATAVQDAGLPAEIALLPAVESGFRAHVYSPNGAAGLWQIMPATGQMLGLKRDWWFDGRRSVPASTQAALVYLQRLNERFDGDWLHALAAYNAGARTVGRAIRRAARRDEPTDFWSIDLPGETDAYVPRLLALVRVVADPAAYGVTLPEVPDRPYFTSVETNGQLDLKVAAKLAEMPVESLLRLNAGYRRWATHPHGPHRLLIPVERSARFVHAVADLPGDQRLRWHRHRIVRGDSLNRIARKYGVSAEAIKQSNRLKDSRIRAGRDLLIPLTESVDPMLTTASVSQAQQRVTYRVRRGDSLYKIARRFQVTIPDLRRWNQVGRYLQPGEKLTVFVDPDA